MAEFSRIYKTELSDRQLMAFWALVQASGRDRCIGYERPAMDGPAFCRFLRRPTVHPWLLAWRGRPMALYYLTDRQGRSAHVHFCFLPCGTRRIHVPADAVPAALGPESLRRQGGEKEREGHEERVERVERDEREGRVGDVGRDGLVRREGDAVPTVSAQVRGAGWETGRGAGRGELGPHGRTVRLPLLQAAALFGLASLLWESSEQGFRLDTLIGITPESNAAALAFVRSLGAREHGTVPGLCWLDEAGLNVPGVLTTFNREVVPQRAARL